VCPNVPRFNEFFTLNPDRTIRFTNMLSKVSPIRTNSYKQYICIGVILSESELTNSSVSWLIRDRFITNKNRIVRWPAATSQGESGAWLTWLGTLVLDWMEWIGCYGKESWCMDTAVRLLSTGSHPVNYDRIFVPPETSWNQLILVFFPSDSGLV
jgi:hypothetical protein